MERATHVGSCQCCGRVQKLPGGLLSKHGYSVEWGFFQGVCVGAATLPYEQSCDLIKGFVESARKGKAGIEADIDALLRPATEPVGWYHEYIPRQTRVRGGYSWRRVRLLQEVVRLPHGDATFLKYVGHDGKEERLPYYGTERDLLEVATRMNSDYVENNLRPAMRELERYIVWQQRRIADWKPRELRPVEDPKDARDGRSG